MEELANTAVQDICKTEGSNAKDTLRLSFGTIVGTTNKLANAMENGEYDFDGTHEKKKPSPIKLRAEAVKAKAADVEAVKSKVDLKEEEVKELKKQIRMKQEELSEQQVRIGLVEKKLENKHKETEEEVNKIQRKLDDSHLLLKKKEKEFEETYDALQSDIDNLEQEKTELKERLRVLSKNTLLQNMSRQSSSQGGSPAGGNAGASNGSAPQTSLLQQQIASLREALSYNTLETHRLKAEKMKEQLAKLQPLNVPKKPVGLATQIGLTASGDDPDNASSNPDINRLMNTTRKLLMEANKLSSCPKVVDISNRQPATTPVTNRAGPAKQLIDRVALVTSLGKETQELQVQVTTLLAANRTGGQVRTDFSTFPTPEFARMLHEKSADSMKVGCIRFPTSAGKGEVIPINVQPDQLKQIHRQLIM